MGNLFASTGLGDEKPHERDVEYCGFAGRRPYERQNENPETPAVHSKTISISFSAQNAACHASGFWRVQFSARLPQLAEHASFMT